MLIDGQAQFTMKGGEEMGDTQAETTPTPGTEPEQPEEKPTDDGAQPSTEEAAKAE